MRELLALPTRQDRTAAAEAELNFTREDLLDLLAQGAVWGALSDRPRKGEVFQPQGRRYRHILVQRTTHHGSVEQLDNLVSWHESELARLEGHGFVIPRHYSVYEPNTGGNPARPSQTLYTIRPRLRGKVNTVRDTNGPITSRRMRRIGRQLFDYFTDSERPAGVPVIAGITSGSWMWVAGKPTLRNFDPKVSNSVSHEMGNLLEPLLRVTRLATYHEFCDRKLVVASSEYSQASKDAATAARKELGLPPAAPDDYYW